MIRVYVCEEMKVVVDKRHYEMMDTASFTWRGRLEPDKLAITSNILGECLCQIHLALRSHPHTLLLLLLPFPNHLRFLLLKCVPPSFWSYYSFFHRLTLHLTASLSVQMKYLNIWNRRYSTIQYKGGIQNKFGLLQGNSFFTVSIQQTTEKLLWNVWKIRFSKKEKEIKVLKSIYRKYFSGESFA